MLHEHVLFTPVQRVRVGVIGLGRAGIFFHCRPILESEDFEIAGVHDPRVEVGQKAAETYQCPSFARVEDLITSEDIDLVVVAAPSVWHHPLALAAIRAGKAVLVEKPFACSVREAEEIFEAAERAGVFVGAFHNRRFDPDVRCLREILGSGDLGDVLKVTINLHSFARRKDWQTRLDKGGGAIANWGAHSLDWCVHLFGTGLQCTHASLFHAINPGDAEDSFHLLLETPERTLIQIEYMNFAACPLPRWHVLGRHGTAISEGETFRVRYHDPAKLLPLEADANEASDGTYSVEEDLGWSERTVPWGHWDNAPPYYQALAGHLRGEQAAPAEPAEVLTQLRIIEQVRARANRHPAAFVS